MTRTKRIYTFRHFQQYFYWFRFPSSEDLWHLPFNYHYRVLCRGGCRKCKRSREKQRRKLHQFEKRFWIDQIRSYPMLV